MASIVNVPGLGSMSDWFRWRLDTGLEARDVDPSCVAGMIHIESGFKPHIVNAIGAAGLIQVLPSTAHHAYGYSASAIAAMSPEDQLEKVILRKRWPKRSQGADCGHVYLDNFLPAYTWASDETVLGDKTGASGSLKGGLSTKSVYLCNSSGGCKGNPETSWALFDSDKDGRFTVGDVKNFMRGKMKAWEDKHGRLDIPSVEPKRPASSMGTDDSMLAIGAILLGGISFALWRFSRGKT